MIDFVIKLGGSILYNINDTRILLNKLVENKLNATYIIGSGQLGEKFKEIIHLNEITVSNDIAINCWSNIQSINANIITSINSNFVLCDSKKEILVAINKGESPIINTIYFNHFFKKMKYQTVDVRSSVLCHELNCKKIVIITNINGIFNKDPKSFKKTKKIKHIKAIDLQTKGRTSVDMGFAEKLIKYNILAYVVGYQDFVKSKLDFDNYIETKSTKIYP